MIIFKDGYKPPIWSIDKFYVNFVNRKFHGKHESKKVGKLIIMSELIQNMLYLSDGFKIEQNCGSLIIVGEVGSPAGNNHWGSYCDVAIEIHKQKAIDLIAFINLHLPHLK